MPACRTSSIEKTAGGSNKVILLKTKKQPIGDIGDSAVSYRVPVGYKVGKQTVVVASDFLLLRKGRTTGLGTMPAVGSDWDQAQISGIIRYLQQTKGGATLGH